MSNSPPQTYTDKFLLKDILDSDGNVLPTRQFMRIVGGTVSDNPEDNSTDITIPGGATVYQPTLDASSPAVVAGDSAVSASQPSDANVARLQTSTVGAAPAPVGLVTVAAPAGGTPTVQTTGTVPGSITGLGAGAVALAAASPATGKLVRSPYPDGSELAVGTTDAHGNVTVQIAAATGTHPRRVFNVKGAPYFALGNGLNDDTGAINAAIAACVAAGGGTVFLPRGVYRITGTINVLTAVRLVGEKSHYVAPGSMVGSVIRWDNTITSGVAMQLQANADNGDVRDVEIEDLILHGDFALDANTVTGLVIAGSAGGHAVSGVKIKAVTIAEFNVGCLWGDDADSQADSVRWELCDFQYCNTYGVHIQSNNAADASELVTCFFNGDYGDAPDAVGLFAEFHGFLKLSHCEGGNIGTFVKCNASSGNTLILENCETESVDWFLDDYGASDGRALVLVGNSINNAVRIDAIDRVIATGNYMQGQDAAGAVVGLILGAGSHWIGTGNRWAGVAAASFLVNTTAGGVFDERDLPHAGGLYSGEYQAQGQTTYRPSSLYDLGGTVDSFAFARLTTRSGIAGQPWTSDTIIPTVLTYVVAVPDNGRAFVFPTVSTTIAAGSNGQALPQSTIYLASVTGLPTAGSIYIPSLLGFTEIAYTGISGSTLTGCTTTGTGTLVTGQVVNLASATTGGSQPTWSLGTTVAAGSDGAVLPQATIHVASTSEFASGGGKFWVESTTGQQEITYTGTSGGNAFTGCTGGTGTLATGDAVGGALTTGDGGVTWLDVGPSSLCELLGVPGQMRLDALPGDFERQGTHVYRRSVATGKALGRVAIADTTGATTADWRSFGIVWGSDDGQTPAFNFPLLGSSLEEKPLTFGQTTINATTTTYDLAAADYINTYIGLAGTPGGALTVNVPAAPTSSVYRFVFSNSLMGGYAATISAGGSLTVTIPYGTALEVAVVGDNVLPVYAVANAQPTRAGQLTSAAGTPGTGTTDVGSSFSQSTLNNNFATLVARLNALEAIVHDLGLST